MPAPNIKTYTLNHTYHHYGMLRLLVELNGDIVKNASFELGYNHKAIEKMLEEYNYKDFNAHKLLTSISGGAGQFLYYSYCQTIEKFLKLKISQYDEYSRILYMEFLRIYNHINMVKNILKALDIKYLVRKIKKIENKINDLINKLNASNISFIKIGGINAAITDDIISDIENYIKYEFSKDMRLINNIADNKTFKHRTVSIGIMSRDLASINGVSGCNLRATGVGFDLRKNMSYSSYNKLDFSIILTKSGDCYSRFLTRIYEIPESIKIIDSCLEELLGLEYEEKNRRLLNRLPIGDVYSAVESANGEIGINITSNETLKPLRVRIKNSGFGELQAINNILEGAKLSDVPIIMSSLDLNISLLDK